MDPISAVLSLLKPSSYMFRGLDAGGTWSLRFPATDSIRCYALISGNCWLVVDGLADPIRLSEGDCFLLTRKQSFRLASDPETPPSDMEASLSTTVEGGLLVYNGGGGARGLGGFFQFDGSPARALLAQLPPIVHVRNESTRSSLIASMELMMQELREPQAGGSLVAQHLAQMMLVLAIRSALSKELTNAPGWLQAISDKQMSAVMAAIHGHPDHPWTLQSLAEKANLSRSTFAARFKQAVGTSPMDYLQRWRMMLAVDKLMNSSDSISVIGMSVGYESDSSFSTAFKRVMGCPPGRYLSMRAATTSDSMAVRTPVADA